MQPFSFECEKRAGLRSADAAASSSSNFHVPMAEFVANYQSRTPPRFKHIPSTPPGPNHETECQIGLRSHHTRAKTPKLLTKGRRRPVKTKGAKEIEEDDVLKMKQCVLVVTLVLP